MASPNQPADSSDPAINRLRGKTVLVTRPAGQTESVRDQLEQLGAKVVLHPAIEIRPMADSSELDACLRALQQTEEFGWVVFVSGNGVTHVASRLEHLGISIDVLASRSIAAIGTSTLTQLKSLGVDHVISPEISNSESLAALLIKQVGGQALIFRANRGSEELGKRLQSAGVDFEEVVAYRSVDVETADPGVLEMIAQGKIDWVTITSSAIANSTIKLFSTAISQSGGKTKTVSISPRTSQAMRDLGFEPDAEASQFNMQGIIAAMQKQD